MKKIICVLMLIPIFFVDAKQTRKMQDVEELLKRSAAQPIPVSKATSTIKIDKAAIIKRLDEQLQSPVASAWDDRVNDLFDLAMVDRELARQYFVKMREKIAVTNVKPVEVVVEKPTETTLPVGEEPIKKAAGRPAPPRKPGAPQEEPTEAPKTEGTAEVPTGEEPMKAPTKKAPPKKVAPKVVEQIFNKSKLEKLDNDKLLGLFNELLEKLGTDPRNWNGMAVERVEEKTKYGSRVYNLNGAPDAQWTNNINTLNKVLISKNIMPETEIIQKTADRIVQVRKEKAVKPAEAAQPEEKPTEALTENELVKEIEKQLAKEVLSMHDFAAIKSNIRALGGFNKEKAAEYDAQLKQRMK